MGGRSQLKFIYNFPKGPLRIHLNFEVCSALSAYPVFFVPSKRKKKNLVKKKKKRKKALILKSLPLALHHMIRASQDNKGWRLKCSLYIKIYL